MTLHKKNFTVYIHTNIITNKVYIGITSLIPPSSRWGKNGIGYSRGQDKFYEAITKYGWNNFTHTIVTSGLSKDEALNLEEELITKYDSVNNGYNTLTTGKDVYMTDDSKTKLREKRIGINNPNYKPNIAHTYIKSRDKNIQEKNKREYYTFPEDEESSDGRKSLEFKNRQKELKTGLNNPNYGKHTWSYGIKMTEEQKQKLKNLYTEERKNKIRQSHLGKNNPQAKKVLCVTTNTVYDTIVDAARDTGISEHSISLCCNNHISVVKNMIFVFYKEGDEK